MSQIPAEIVIETVVHREMRAITGSLRAAADRIGAPNVHVRLENAAAPDDSPCPPTGGNRAARNRAAEVTGNCDTPVTVGISDASSNS